MKINCPDFINNAFKLLEESGFEAYAVGGCIRDSIMNKSPNDWDMTTSAKPEQIISVFSDYRTIPTGINHGTVTVLFDKNLVEITTMRIDGEYTDNRRPEKVFYTDKIEEDLSRRDFTVNAIAFNPRSGIIDPFKGCRDIKNKIITCVGNPDRRFNEDALRIIRALRFASTLSFEIEKNTADSIVKNKHLLNNIANERIRVELIKLLCGDNAEKILLDYKDIIFFIIPELSQTYGFEQHTPYHIYDVWTHTVKTVAKIKSESDFKVAALLHDVAKPQKFHLDKNGIGHFKGHAETGSQISEDILKRLKFSNAEIQRISEIIELHEIRPDGDKKRLKHICSEYSPEAVLDTLELIEADAGAKNPNFYEEIISECKIARKQIEEIIQNNECIKIKNLAVNGNDILNLGYRGKEVNNALQKLLKDVIDEKVENEKNALLKRIKK